MKKKVKTLWSSIILVIVCFILIALIIRFVFVDNSWLIDNNQKIITEINNIIF